MTHPNLILITIDCLRSDHVGFLGYKRPITPCLDRLAAESVVFENAIAAGLPTYYSFPAILAGRYPLAMGRDLIGLSPKERTLASVLQDAGDTTAAFVAGNPYVSRWSGYHQGFDTFNDFLNSSEIPSSYSLEESSEPQDQKMTNRINCIMRNLLDRLPGGRSMYNELYFWYGVWVKSKPYRNNNWEAWRRYPSAQTLNDCALSWLQREIRRPFFLWLHYMDTHRPYLPPVEALHAIERDDLTPLRSFELYNFWIRNDISHKRRARYKKDLVALYDASIWWVDRHIGRLVETLKQHKLLDSTLIAVTSDHGEAFMERGEYDHDPVLVTQEMVRVPLLIRFPNGQPHHYISSVFSLVDLPSTLLEFLDVIPPSSFQGISRWTDIQSRRIWDAVALTEVIYGRTKDYIPQGRSAIPGLRLLCVQDGRYKLVINFREKQENLYDLQSDPGEKKGFPLRENSATFCRLLQEVRNHLFNALQRRYTIPQLQLRLDIIRKQIDSRFNKSMDAFKK